MRRPVLEAGEREHERVDAVLVQGQGALIIEARGHAELDRGALPRFQVRGCGGGREVRELAGGEL